MSDTGRKDIADTVHDKVMPDSLKSSSEKAKESTTSATDKLSREAQLDSSKSTTQSATDKVVGSKDEHTHGGTGGSITDKLKHAVGADKS